MNIKRYSYKLAAKDFDKKINMLEKQMIKISNELYAMTDENSTVRARSNKRTKLARIGEELNYYRDYVTELQALIEEETG